MLRFLWDGLNVASINAACKDLLICQLSWVFFVLYIYMAALTIDVGKIRTYGIFVDDKLCISVI